MDEDKLAQINRNSGSIIGLNKQEAIERLTQLLADEDPAQRVSAIGGLRRIGGSETLAALSKALNYSNDFVRNGAIRAIVKIDGPEACEELSSTLRGSDFKIRVAVVDALGEIGDTQAIKLLAVTLSNTSPALCKSTIESENNDVTPEEISGFSQIIRDRSREILSTLSERLSGERSRHREVRQAAAKALGRIGGQEVLSLLKRQLLWERDYGVKYAIESAIIAIESTPEPTLARPRAAAPARPTLERLPRSGDDSHSLDGRPRSKTDDVAV